MELHWNSSVTTIIAVFLLATCTAGTATGDSGWMIHGMVTDRYGDAVEGAVVRVTGYEDGLLGQVTTDSYGLFSFYYPGQEQLARLDVNYQNHFEQTQWVTMLAGVPVELEVMLGDLPPSGYGELYGVISTSSDSIVYASGAVFTDSGYYHLVDAVEHRQWSLHLPVGTYDIRAQHNSGGYTYYSANHTINVTSDTKLYMLLIIDFTKFQPLVNYPQPGDNRVSGTVFQQDSTPLAGAAVELIRSEHGGDEVVSTTITDVDGVYVFTGVKEYNTVATYTVKASYGQDFTAGNTSSQPFDVYYHDLLGVPHDYSVDVHTDYMWQQHTYDPEGLVRFEGTAGAHIEIEGLDTGHMVPSNFTLAPGIYGYRIWMEGYEEQRDTITYTGEPLIVTANLQPMVGNVNITVQPSRATVTLDGEVLGQGDVQLVNLPQGIHNIRVSADGYHEQVYNLTMLSGAELELSFTLEPYPGRVQVTAPVPAIVLLDGDPVGSGSIDGLEVEPGEHTVSVELEGYHRYEQYIDVAPGADVEVTTGELIPMPSLSGDFLGYTWNNFINGLVGIFEALLNSLGI